MNAKILDGSFVAQKIAQSLKEKISQISDRPLPSLAIIQVAGVEASNIYVKHKLKIATEIGIQTQHILLSQDIDESTFLATVQQLNQDKNIHGILIQLPLPAQLSIDKALELMDPFKDVDGLTPLNLGRLMRKNPLLIPCTPLGIIRLCQYYEIDLRGKTTVILNSSALVGRPLALLLLQEGATPILANSQTRHRAELIRSADILVSATGKAHYVDSSWIKPSAVVIDVGVHRQGNTKKLIGDIDFTSASQVAGWITPVPGGVGPMTIAMLMENVWQAYSFTAKAH